MSRTSVRHQIKVQSPCLPCKVCDSCKWATVYQAAKVGLIRWALAHNGNLSSRRLEAIKPLTLHANYSKAAEHSALLAPLSTGGAGGNSKGCSRDHWQAARYHVHTHVKKQNDTLYICGKSPGIDGILADMIKDGGDLVQQCLLWLFNCMLASGTSRNVCLLG